MSHPIGRWPIFVGLQLLALLLAAPTSAQEPVRKPFGLEKRVPWTTSKVQGSPDPPSPYRTENAFPKLKFFEPLAIQYILNTNRLMLAERPGKIYTFVNDSASAEKQLLLDIGRPVYGLAVHPRFIQNGYFYVMSQVGGPDSNPTGCRVSRYQARPGDPPTADAKSEQVVISWPSGGHMGGCLQFGHDGKLYIATGDGSGIADQLETGQNRSDLLGSILRIDVDKTESNRAYAIPADNPYVGQRDVRGEIWSYGHRQVWRFSFDSANGQLWAGEVGQDLWEMVYLISKGGNYGWSVQEGSHPFRPARSRGPTPILPPIVEHPHSDFRSITGGYVYHGSRLPELRDAYIYGDYDTGKIWMFRYDGKKVSEHRELDDTQLRIVSFGQTRDGEVLLLDFAGGSIHQLINAPPEPTAPQAFPRKLSETGLFASTKEHQPAPGLIPYSVNAELWSDGAKKQRFLAIPGDGKIGFDSVTYPQPAPGAEPGWRFPHDTVIVKTFELEMEKGNPASTRRLETRILHHKYMPGTEEYGDQFWRGYTYVWNDEQTDAELADASGLDRTFEIRDPQAPGGKRSQTWHFPSRAECTLCHTMAAKYALGLTTLQMNRDHNYNGTIANQLATFDHIGLFTEPLKTTPEQLPRLVDYRDESAPVHLRARSYLHANCAHCHRKWGGGNAEFQLLAMLPTSEMGIVGTRPAHGEFELQVPFLLAPRKPERSLINHRVGKTGLGRMPHVGSNVVDKQALDLLDQWVRGMKTDMPERFRGYVPGNP